jgi:YD repeat-containing protein
VVAVQDPNLHWTLTAYDDANRPSVVTTTRGSAPAEDTPADRCEQTSSPIGPSGTIGTGVWVCSTKVVYDTAGDTIETIASDGAITWNEYDDAGRLAATYGPPHTTGVPALVTRTVYDDDGLLTIVCTPRQVTEGDGICDGDAHYATRTTYDALGRTTRVETDREDPTPGAAVVGW